jgi:hypothetical protein
MARAVSGRIQIGSVTQRASQNITILAHDFARSFHLASKLLIERHKPNPLRSFCQVQSVALVEVQACQRFLGQDKASGVSDRNKLDGSSRGYASSLMITLVITCYRQSSRASAMPSFITASNCEFFLMKISENSRS